jgi:hypothetical protein
VLKPTVTLGVLALLVTSGAQAQRGNSYTLSGRTVAYYNLVGSVRVDVGSGSQTVIEVVRRGRDADQLRIVSGDLDGVPTLRVIFPGDDIIDPEMGRGSNTNITVNEDGTFGRGRDRDGNNVRIHGSDRGRDGLEAAADLVVHLPAGVKLEGHLAAGLTDVRGTRSDLEMNSIAGDLVVTRASGALRLSSASGNIEVTESDAETNVSTASGDVRLTGIRSSALKVDVASGDVVLRSLVVSELDISTASGDVDATLDGDVTHADLSTASGTVTVALGSRVNAMIDVGTASGGIDVDVPVQVLSERRNHFRAKLGNGAGDIRIGAASGDVRVVRAR